MHKIIDARRKGECKTSMDSDLLSIILQDPIYSSDIDKTKDEMSSMFAAGNETIKTSSANTVCYLVQNPAEMKRLRDQVAPVIN
jgi:cytochrome P450